MTKGSTDAFYMVLDPSRETNILNVSENPPDSFFELKVPCKSLVSPLVVDHNKLLKYSRSFRKKISFDVNIAHLVPHLPSPLKRPTALFYRSPHYTHSHFDGTMEGGCLTLLTGRKVWTLVSPYDKTTYVTTQEPGETIFVPAGFLHSVRTTSPTSIANGAMWETHLDLKHELICLNRDFLRGSLNPEMSLDLFRDCQRNGVLILGKHGSSVRVRFMLEAGRRFAIVKGGSSKRDASGNPRRKSHVRKRAKQCAR